MAGFNDKPTLSLDHARLEPLTLRHGDGLRGAVCDGRLQELAIISAPASDQVAAYIQTASATCTAFAVIGERSGKVVGSASLYHIGEAVLHVEIGFTWYAQPVQRTHVNTSHELVLLTYAFETLDCVCVGWCADILSTASQRATERLSTQKDGILRRHQIRGSGSVRGTVMYSILHEE